MSAHAGRRGFTLLELLLAVAILSGVMVVTFLTFSAGTTAWRRGMALAENLHHGDFAVDQLVMALRSAYFPEGGAAQGQYGFTLEDQEEGAYPADRISWVKLGTALVGQDGELAGSAHRVIVDIGEDDDYDGLRVRAWRLQGQSDLFDPEQDVAPQVLSRRVRGLNCRVAYQRKDDDIDWLDTWEETNRLPTVVELTVFLEPLEERGDPVELKRIIGIPVAPLAWR